MGVRMFPVHGLPSTKMKTRAVESNLIIICGCLPTLRIFLRIGGPRKAKSTAAYSSASTPAKGFTLQTFGQSNRRSRKYFDTIAEIDAIDGLDLSENAKDYRATITAYAVEGADCIRSDEGNVRPFSVSVNTAGSSWNESQEGVDVVSDIGNSGPLSPTRG